MPSAKTPTIMQQDGVTVIQLGPAYENLDENLLDELRGNVMEIVQNAEPPLVVLDLSHTKFFGSAFIEVLFRMSNRLKAREGEFALSALTPYCAEILSITHLDKLWAIYPNSDEAVAAIRRSDA